MLAGFWGEGKSMEASNIAHCQAKDFVQLHTYSIVLRTHACSQGLGSPQHPNPSLLRVHSCTNPLKHHVTYCGACEEEQAFQLER